MILSIFAKQKIALHPLERATLGALVLESLFLPWAWGTRDLWAQFTALALALVAFSLALWPRVLSAGKRGEDAQVLLPWLRLKRFPLFWLGLLLCGLIALQSGNAAWRYETNTKFWWVIAQPHWEFLPTGVNAPWDIGNGWRMLVIYATAWLTICALWIGLSRRRSLQILLSVLAANVVLITVVGMAHRISGSTQIMWSRQFYGAIGFGPFIYHNHGGAFVALFVMVGIALAAWHKGEETRRMARSSPALVWLISALIITVGVALSTSRAATALVLGCLVLSALAWFGLRRWMRSEVPQSRLLPVLLTLGFLAWGGFLLTHVDLGGVVRKFEALQKQGSEEMSYKWRVIARGSAVEMLSEHWLYGTGAGSFRYTFASYVHKNPELMATGVWWDHAHIDWLEIPIEFGLVGCLIIGGSMIWCLVKWIQWRGWRHPIALFLFIGCMQTLVHALVDFPFQNTAIIVTWWTFVVLALRWLELDNLLAEARQEAQETRKF